MFIFICLTYEKSRKCRPGYTNLPVHVVLGFLEAGEDRHRTVQTRELLFVDGAESAVLHGTGDGIFPETVVKAHCGERTYTSPQPAIPADFPCYKQWTETRFMLDKLYR